MSKTTETTWAVINAGGKQHVARVGSKIIVNQVKEKEGETIRSVNVLDSSPVSLKVIRHFLGEKVRGLKFKNKVRYLKRYGHRQQLSTLEVISIGESTPLKEKAPAKTKAVKPKSVKSKKEGKNG